MNDQLNSPLLFTPQSAVDQNTTTLCFLACVFFTGTWTSSWSALILLDSRPRVMELAAKKKIELTYMLTHSEFSVDVVTLGRSDSLEFWCSGQSFWKCSTEPQTRQQPPTRTKLHNMSVTIHRDEGWMPFLSYPLPWVVRVHVRVRASSGFDRGVGVRGRGRYPLKPSIFTSLLETKRYQNTLIQIIQRVFTS